MQPAQLRKRVRILLGFFIVALFMSGLTAIPIASEMAWLNDTFGVESNFAQSLPELSAWLTHVNEGVQQTSLKYPFMAYGTDWLAFGHFILALAFVGPWRDPVKNIWVIQLGMIACVLILPYALLFGYLRGIPFYWRIIDCSFGLFGILPLLLVYRYARRLELQND